MEVWDGGGGVRKKSEDLGGKLKVSPELASKLREAREGVYMRLGNVRMMMEDYVAAVEAYEMVVNINPQSIKALCMIARAFCFVEDYKKGLQYAQRVLSIDADHWEAWSLLGYCCFMTNEYAKACQSYFKAVSNLRLNPDGMLLYGLGLVNHYYGQSDLAVKLWLEAQNAKPKFERSGDLYQHLATVLEEKNAYDHCITYLNQCMLEDQGMSGPTFRPRMLYRLGHIYELKGEMKLAEEAYSAAIRESSDETQAPAVQSVRQIAWIRHTEGRNEEALQMASRACDTNPMDSHSFYIRARIQMSMSMSQEAYESLQQAFRTDSRNPLYWCTIGILYSEMSQYRDAMDAYTQAIRLNAYVFEVWYNLGALYESCGQSEDSLDAYRRAQELAPENQVILLALQNAKVKGNRPVKPMLPTTNPNAPVLSLPQLKQRAEEEPAAMRQSGMDLIAISADLVKKISSGDSVGVTVPGNSTAGDASNEHLPPSSTFRSPGGTPPFPKIANSISSKQQNGWSEKKSDSSDKRMKRAV